MLLSMVYHVTRRVLGSMAVLLRREVSKDAELLVLRHGNVVLRRQIRRVRHQPADRFWFAVLMLVGGVSEHDARSTPRRVVDS